jgi:hypothetical protein
MLTEGEADRSLQSCTQVKNECVFTSTPLYTFKKDRPLSHYLYSVLLGTFYLKREGTKDWRKLLNEEILNLHSSLDIIKGKAVPLQAWSGLEDSRKLRFPDFLTTLLVGGKIVSFTRRPHLPPGNIPSTHFC